MLLVLKYSLNIIDVEMILVKKRSNMSQPHFGISVRMKLTPPKVGSWSPPGLPKD
jgi:hypothetical protein